MPDHTPKYRVLIRGKKFACSICGAVFDGGNSRNMAIRCHESHREPEPEVYNPQPNPRIDKLPGEGTSYADRWHHWRRVCYGSKDYNRVEMNKAWHQLDLREAKIDKLLSDFLDRKPHKWKRQTSPLQRLSYAYHYGGWEAVKQAAYNLAYDEAIQRRLDDLNIPDVIRELLHLETLLKEMLDDNDFIRFKQAEGDVQAVINKLELDNFIDELNLDDFKGKEE